MDRRQFLGSAIASAAALTAGSVTLNSSSGGPKSGSKATSLVHVLTITAAGMQETRSSFPRQIPDLFDYIAHEFPQRSRAEWLEYFRENFSCVTIYDSPTSDTKRVLFT